MLHRWHLDNKPGHLQLLNTATWISAERRHLFPERILTASIACSAARVPGEQGISPDNIARTGEALALSELNMRFLAPLRSCDHFR